MTRAEKQQFDQFQEQLKDIHIALVGNKEMGLIGLVAKQEADERFKIKVTEELGSIHESMQKIFENQQKASNERKTIRERLDSLESFMHVFNALSKIKKKSVIALSTIISAIGAMIGFWEQIRKFFENIFN